MFTVNIRKIMAGKGGMKWDAPAVTAETPTDVTLVEKLSKESDPVKRDALIDIAIKQDAKAVNSELNNLSVTLLSSEGKDYSKYQELIAAIQAGQERALEDTKTISQSLRANSSPKIAEAAEAADTTLAIGTGGVIKAAKKNEAILKINIAAGGDFQSSLDKGKDGRVTLKSMTGIISAGDDMVVESRNV